MEKSSICRELKVNWSRMDILITVDTVSGRGVLWASSCRHCSLPAAAQSPGPCSLSHPVPRALQGSWGRRGCTGGHTWNKPGSPQHQALLWCLGSLLAVGTEPLQSPPSSLGTPCPSFHANPGSYWLPGWLAGYTVRSTFSIYTHSYSESRNPQSVMLVILSFCAQIYYSPNCFDKWKLLPHFFAIAALNHQKQEKDLLWMLNLHWPLQASDLLGAAVSLLTCFLQERSH